MCGNSLYRKPKKSNIYLMNIIGTDIYKIGFTEKHPIKRTYDIKRYVGEVKIISYVYAYTKHESEFHNYLKDKKVDNGFREYFRLSPSDVNFVLDLFEEIKMDEPIMDNNHSNWKEFIRNLSFWVERVSKKCDHTFKHSRKYLNECNEINIENSIEFFKNQGINCDCEVLKSYK